MTFTFTLDPNPWEELPALAERLGVKPNRKVHGVTIHVDGQVYSVFDLVNALLDIVDQHVPKPPPTADVIQFRKKAENEG